MAGEHFPGFSFACGITHRGCVVRETVRDRGRKDGRGGKRGRERGEGIHTVWSLTVTISPEAVSSPDTLPQNLYPI